MVNFFRSYACASFPSNTKRNHKHAAEIFFCFQYSILIWVEVEHVNAHTHTSLPAATTTNTPDILFRIQNEITKFSVFSFDVLLLFHAFFSLSCLHSKSVVCSLIWWRSHFKRKFIHSNYWCEWVVLFFFVLLCISSLVFIIYACGFIDFNASEVNVY